MPSPSQQGKRAAHAGAPPYEALFVLAVKEALRIRLMGAGVRDLILDSAPLTAWRRRASLHALVVRLSRPYAALACLSSCAWRPPTPTTPPSPSHCWPWPSASMACTRAWCASTLPILGRRARRQRRHPYNAKRTTQRSCLPPTWTRAELAKRTAIERFFARLFRAFLPQRPPLAGWSAVTCQVALAFTATIIVALAAQQAWRPDLIRSPARVLAHVWEGIL